MGTPPESLSVQQLAGWSRKRSGLSHAHLLLLVVGAIVLCSTACRGGQTGQTDKQDPPFEIEAGALPILLEERIVGEHFAARAYMDQEIGFRTYLSVASFPVDPEIEWATLSFFCDAQRLTQTVHVGIKAFRRDPESNQRVVVTLSPLDAPDATASFGSSPQGHWWRWGLDVYETQMEIYDGTSFLREAKRHQEVWVRIPLPGRVAETRFDLRGVFDTPIQPNLDWCGAY